MINRPKERQFVYKGILIIIALLFLVPFVDATWSSDPTLNNNLMAYYTFDDIDHSNNNVRDITDQGRNVTVVGGLTSGVAGLIGETFLYTNDGAKHININPLEVSPFIGNPTPGAGLTINVWVNITDLTSEEYIMGDANHNVIENGWSIRTAGVGSTNLNYLAHNGGTWPDISAVCVGCLTLDGWAMVTLIKNGTDLVWYKNGAYVSATSDTSGPAEGGYDLLLGRDGFGNGPMSGKLDELGFWNRTLIPSEITALYNSGLGLPHDGQSVIANFTFSGVTDEFNGSDINIFNITMFNGTNYEFNTTTGNISTFLLSNATELFNITFQALGYLNNTWIDHNISERILSFGSFFNMSRHNISAYVAPSNQTLIHNFTVNSSEGVSVSTLTGSMEYPTSWNTSIDLIFYADEGNYTTPTFAVPGSINGKYNFSVYVAQTFHIEIWDEITNVLLDYVTTTLDLISDAYGNNYTRTNGSYQIGLITPGDYIIRYDSDDFFTRTYYKVLEEGSYNQLTLYLLNSSYSYAINVTANVLDTLENQIEDATITTTKYYADSNSYKTVENTQTNFEGKAGLSLTTNEYYIFQIEYDGDSVLTTTPTYIFEDEITFVIDIGADPTTEFYNSLDIDLTLTFNNVTNNFVYTYSDPQSRFSTTCLEVWKVNAFAGDTLENGSCSSSHSGTIIAGVTEINGTTYLGKAYATINGEKTLLASLYTEFKANVSFGNMGLLLVALLTIVFALIGFWNPFVALILAPIPLIFGAMLSIIAIPTGVAIGVWVAFVFVAILIGRLT